MTDSAKYILKRLGWITYDLAVLIAFSLLFVFTLREGFTTIDLTSVSTGLTVGIGFLIALALIAVGGLCVAVTKDVFKQTRWILETLKEN